MSKFYQFTFLLLLFSLSIGLMPLSSKLKLESNNVSLYIVGIIFWVTLIGLGITSNTISAQRKRDSRYQKKQTRSQWWGIVQCFKNKYATIADIVMIVAAISLVVCTKQSVNQYIQFGVLSVLTFSFGMHCMLNGSNYTYMKFKYRSGDNNE